jgi:hypothetical protein
MEAQSMKYERREMKGKWRNIRGKGEGEKERRVRKLGRRGLYAWIIFYFPPS